MSDQTTGKQAAQAREDDGPAGEAREGPDFEQALGELEALVERMEAGELSLEDSLACYERGVRLGRTCEKALASAEQRIRILSERDGADALEPYREPTPGDAT